MILILRIIILFVVYITSISYAGQFAENQENWFGESFTTFRYNSINGNEQQAFLKKDLSVVEELQINGKEKISKDGNFSVVFRGRATNDEKIGSKKFGLLKFLTEINSGDTYVGIGDVSPDASEFIITQNIKGGYIKQDGIPFGEDLSLSIFGGNTGSNWERFWGDGQQDFKQYSFGIRANQQLPYKTETGLDFISTFDDEKSANPLNLASRKNSIISWDFTSKIIRSLNVSGEIAKSFKDYDDNRQRIDTQSDLAYRVKTGYTFDKSTVNIRYYRVEPNFDSLVGSSSNDSERIKGSYAYEFTENISSEISYNFRRNNLRNQKTSTTKTNVPSLTTELKIDEASKLNFEIRSEFRYKDGDAIDDRNISLSPYFTSKFDNLNYNLKYEFRYQEDRTINQLNHRVNLIDAGLKYPFEADKIPIIPFSNFGFIFDKNTKVNSYDTTYNISFGSDLILWNDLNVNINHQISKFNTETTGGQNSVQNTTTVKFDYNMLTLIGINTVPSFEFCRRDLKYTGGGNDYTENAFNVSIKTKF